MDKAALEEQLQEISNARDDGRLHELVNSLSADDRERYKRELADAFLDIYAVWQYDFMCDKVITSEGPDAFIAYQLELLAEADKLDPSRINYEQRADCYQTLADLKDNQEDQLVYIEKAEQEILEALKTKPDTSALNNQLVGILLQKIKIGRLYKEEDFVAALVYFEQALLNYKSPNQLNIIYHCFTILNIPFPRSQHWYGVYLDKLQAVLHLRAQKDQAIYVDWANELKRIIHNHAPGSPVPMEDLIKQSVDVLNQLRHFETDDQETLNHLGSAFSKTADELGKAGATTAALDHYELAVKYFTKAQDINPAAWTHPVYATNALMAMAAIYHAQHDKTAVIKWFERGQKIFLQIYESEKDFTANIYWGEFLINYARLAYNFESPAILQAAEEKLLIAQQLGKQYYDHPYIALAKVALKLGDPQKCLAILKECKTVFSHEHATYNLSKVIEDADFDSLKQEIIAMN